MGIAPPINPGCPTRLLVTGELVAAVVPPGVMAGRLSAKACNRIANARLACFAGSGPARGPPEAPCAAQQCGNGAPAPLVSASTDFPIKLG